MQILYKVLKIEYCLFQVNIMKIAQMFAKTA